MANSDFQDTWDRLNMWTALLPNYPHFNMPFAGMRFYFMDEILSALLYINAVSILDEGLETYIDTQGLSCPKKQYRANLDGRLRCLNDQGKLANFSELDRIRRRRNDFGHEVEQSATWEELQQDVAHIATALQHLGLIQPTPEYQFLAQQGIAEASPDQNALCEQRYFVGLNDKASGAEVLRYRWTRTTMNRSSG